MPSETLRLTGDLVALQDDTGDVRQPAVIPAGRILTLYEITDDGQMAYVRAGQRLYLVGTKSLRARSTGCNASS